MPATKHKFLGVNCTFVIGVLFVGKVDSKSVLKHNQSKSTS